MSDICRNCGEELTEGAKFCGSCGAKAEPASPPAEPLVSEQPADTAPEPNTAPEHPAAYPPPEYAVPISDGYQPPQPEGYAPAGQPTPPYYAPNAVPPQGQYGQPPYGAPPQGQYAQPPYGAPGYGMQPAPKKKSKIGIIIGIIIVVIVAAIAVIIVVSKNAYDKNKTPNGDTNSSETGTTAETAADHQPAGDVGFDEPEDAIAEYINGIGALVKGGSTFGDIMSSCYEYQYAESDYKATIKETIEEQNDTVGSTFEMLSAYADDLTVSYKDFEKKTLTADEQKKFIEDNMIDVYCSTDSIEEICTCSFTMVMSFSGIDSDSEMQLSCIKADGRWFLSFSTMEE